jgi:2-amino-4-hydroxy-6-hydroxymethyldihydropteridine diphosphokinase
MNTDSHVVFLLLGGNRGDRQDILRKACNEVSASMGVIKRVSSLYETDPWGFADEMKFLNQAVELASSLSPDEILKEIHRIERLLGRERGGEGYSSRTLDIDILFYDDQVVDREELIIPHPRLHLRRFALEPMNEIAGGLLHPVLGESIMNLLNKCEDSSVVNRILNSDESEDTIAYHV